MAHELRGAARKKELELEAELERQKAEVERLKKENADMQSSRRDAICKAFLDGEDQATEDYKKQMDEISKLMFEEGCHTVLKELEIPEDHPIYQSLPRCPSPETEPDSDPTAEAPVEPSPAPLQRMLLFRQNQLPKHLMLQ